MTQLPQVKFTDTPPKFEIEMFSNFLFKDSWGWSKYIYKNYPELKPIKKLKTQKEKDKFLKEFIINYRKTNKKDIEESKIRYQKEWIKIEKKYFKILSQILQTDWPKNKKIIKAMVSMNIICPRFLDDWSFSVFYSHKNLKHILVIIAHECCHFLYFKKWQEIYPKAKRKTFNTPHIEWHLSEILAPIILNDKRIQKILKSKDVFYDEYLKIKIKNKTVPEHFNDLYNKHLKQNTNFEHFLKESYSEIKKHKKLFLNI